MAARYPNQQLRSVSLETYFPGRFAATAAWGLVQERLSHRLPQLFVPGDTIGAPPALRPYQLRDDQGTRSLALALNQATYIALSDYPGFDDFIAEAVPVLEDVHATAGGTALSRVAYRYENAVSLGRGPDGTLALAEIIELDLPAWAGTNDLRSLNLELRRGWERGEVHVHLFDETEGGGSVLRLVIAADVRHSEAARLAHDAAAAHAQARGVFESMIAPTFRAFLEWTPSETTEEQ